MLRTGRKGLAAATLICDMLKGTLAVLISGYYGGPDAAMLAALGAFLGHLFPVWLGFKGGKGVAVYIGVLIGLFWPAAVLFCVLWIVTAAMSRYSSLSALVASVVTPIFLWWFGHLALRHVVRRADPAAVLHAPRQHRAVAGGNRGTDRAEEIACPRYCRFSASSTKLAAAIACASAPNRAMTVTPTGNPPSATSVGTLTQGVPIKVHSRL